MRRARRIVARHAVALSVVLAAAGCVATNSTIGGYDSVGIAKLVQEANDRCRARGRPTPEYPFTTDGCTLFPDGAWQRCCVEHDMTYWCGGSEAERKASDELLRTCVAATGHPWIARAMSCTVRVTAPPWMPTWWRWGYGFKWPRGYEP